MLELIIRNRLIGDDRPPVVNAEIGVNHGRSLDLAFNRADGMIGTGAGIVKYQVYNVGRNIRRDETVHRLACAAAS
jgi:sialic acid synthase SpsE